MYGLSREVSAVRKDSNNQCREVSRGHSTGSRVGPGRTKPRRASVIAGSVVDFFSSQMSEKGTLLRDDRTEFDNMEQVTITTM